MNHDPNHLWGPLRRSDVIAVICFGLATYLGVQERQWESVAFALLVGGGLAAGLSPRFQGHIGLKIGSLFQLGATLAKPAQPPRVQSSSPVRVRRSPRPQPAEAQRQDLPSQAAELAED